MPSDALLLDAVAQAELIRSGEVQAEELVEAAIARCEQWNPAINAVTQTLYESARDAVRDAQFPGPFQGVPFLVKDFYCHMKGTVTSGSSKLLTSNLIDHDSELMARYRRAGLVTIGKTNVPEMVSMGTTESDLFGPSRNPWDTRYTPGGSSGGSAAAVAAGVVAVAHANDGAGSTRIPASCCGLFGLKPSRGRITLGPDVGESIGGITAEHVVSRSVRDSAALLDMTQGAMPGDPYVAPTYTGTFLSATQCDPKPLRIAMALDPLYPCAVSDECRDAVQKAARLAESLGHRVETASIALDGTQFRTAVENFWSMTITRGMVAMAQQRNQDVEALVAQLEPFNQYLFERGIRRRAVDYLQDLVLFQSIARRLGQFFEKYDVWLTPTLPFTPPLLGYFDARVHGAEEAYRRVIDSFAFTVPANLTGLPAASVPLGGSKSGLPVGVQIAAKLGDEMTLFQLAAQLERSAPWAHRLPSFNANTH